MKDRPEAPPYAKSLILSVYKGIFLKKRRSGHRKSLLFPKRFFFMIDMYPYVKASACDSTYQGRRPRSQLIKDVPSYLGSGQAGDGSSEIDAAAYVGVACHRFIGGSVTGIGRPVFRKRQGEMAV